MARARNLTVGITAVLFVALMVTSVGVASTFPPGPFERETAIGARLPDPDIRPAATWVEDSGWTYTRQSTDGSVEWTRSGTSQDISGFDSVITSLVSPVPASASGCATVDETQTWRSLVSTLAVFHHRVYWCWSYPKITGVNVSCYATDVDQFVEFVGCSGSGNYYTWSGSPQGGHYSFRQGTFKNCVPVLGCIAWAYPWIKVWVNGNGAWTSQKGW